MAAPKKYRVGKSKIQGQGVFAKKDLNVGEYIGKAHTINELYTDYDFTELGKKHNHSEDSNVQNILIGNERHLVATRPIKKGEELTSNYRLQQDLEQPEDFKQGGKLTSSKARKILHDKEVHGHPLTDKQRRFFGAIAGGAKPYKAENGIEGTMGGLTDKGFNYNGAWGGPSMEMGGILQPPMAGANQTVPMAQLGDSVKPIPMQLAMGGSMPGAVGFTYARTVGAAPANGPYAKKTKASAQDGKKVSYSQWKKQYNLKETPDYNLKRAWELGYTPDKTGHLPTVDNQTGQFLKAKGHPTLQLELDWYNSPEAADFRSKNAIDSSGKFFKYVPKGQNGQEMKYYQEGLDFKPKTISKNGGWLDKFDNGGVSVNNADAQPLKKLDQLLNFTNYNKPTKGGWLDKYN